MMTACTRATNADFCRAAMVGSALALTAVVTQVAAAKAAEPTAAITERIVVIRHGEKPGAGLGQLACKGLARSLALPDVVLARFGKPDALFAPNPGIKKPDHGRPYNYIRPLATIEPLAIRVSLPVNVGFAFDDIKGLGRALSARKAASETVVVAWEHNLAVPLMQALIKQAGGDPAQVAAWKDDDFDRMDVVEIKRMAGRKASVSYVHGQQGLTSLSDECPRGDAPKATK